MEATQQRSQYPHLVVGTAQLVVMLVLQAVQAVVVGVVLAQTTLQVKAQLVKETVVVLVLTLFQTHMEPVGEVLALLVKGNNLIQTAV
jgi:hypothetical protein